MVMTVEISDHKQLQKEEHVVCLFVDDSELEMLIADLTALRESKFGSNTVTYFSDSWGTGPLSEARYIEGSPTTHCLKICRKFPS